MPIRPEPIATPHHAYRVVHDGHELHAMRAHTRTACRWVNLKLEQTLLCRLRGADHLSRHHA